MDSRYSKVDMTMVTNVRTDASSCGRFRSEHGGILSEVHHIAHVKHSSHSRISCTSRPLSARQMRVERKEDAGSGCG